MSKIYERCEADHEAHTMAREIIQAHHSELVDGMMDKSLKLCIMMVSESENDDSAPAEDSKKKKKALKPALKTKGGMPALFNVSVINLKQRADLRPDAEILLDELAWNATSETQKRAILDAAVTYLTIAKDENGFVKTDDIGRPKLSCREPDYELAGFRSIARRYGADAPEVMAATQWEKDYGPDLLLKENLFTGSYEREHEGRLGSGQPGLGLG